MPGDALLRGIAGNPEAAFHLSCDGEFGLARTDPIESIALPNGLPVEPVAGCGAGGTHHLCGPAVSDGSRPVLHTDSEAQLRRPAPSPTGSSRVGPDPIAADIASRHPALIRHGDDERADPLKSRPLLTCTLDESSSVKQRHDHTLKRNSTTSPSCMT